MPNLYLELKSFFNRRLSYQDAFFSYQVKKYQKIIKLLRIYLLYLLWMVFVISLIAVVGAITKLNYQNNNLELYLSDKKLPELLLSVAIIAPIIEEIIYRFWIKLRLKYGFYFAQILFLGYFIYHQFVVLKPWSPNLIIILLASEIFLTYWYIFQDRIIKLFSNHYIWIVFISSILFASGHFANYSNLKLPAWYLILLVLPQFSLGLILAFVRTRLGIGYSILLHAINNLFFALQMALSTLNYATLLLVTMCLVLINFGLFLREISKSKQKLL